MTSLMRIGRLQNNFLSRQRRRRLHREEEEYINFCFTYVVPGGTRGAEHSCTTFGPHVSVSEPWGLHLCGVTWMSGPGRAEEEEEECRYR